MSKARVFYRIHAVFSILSFMSPAEPVNIHIDGILDFGKKWSYQYEVNLPEETTTKNVGRNAESQDAREIHVLDFKSPMVERRMKGYEPYQPINEQYRAMNDPWMQEMSLMQQRLQFHTPIPTNVPTHVLRPDLEGLRIQEQPFKQQPLQFQKMPQPQVMEDYASQVPLMQRTQVPGIQGIPIPWVQNQNQQQFEQQHLHQMEDTRPNMVMQTQDLTQQGNNQNQYQSEQAMPPQHWQQMQDARPNMETQAQDHTQNWNQLQLRLQQMRESIPREQYIKPVIHETILTQYQNQKLTEQNQGKPLKIGELALMQETKTSTTEQETHKHHTKSYKKHHHKKHHHKTTSKTAHLTAVLQSEEHSNTKKNKHKSHHSNRKHKHHRHGRKKEADWDGSKLFKKRHTSEEISNESSKHNKEDDNRLKDILVYDLHQSSTITFGSQPLYDTNSIQNFSVPKYDDNKLIINTVPNESQQKILQTLTNLTFGEIFNSPQKINSNTQIKTFATHILTSGMKLFDGLKQKINDDSMKLRIDDLASSYQTSYKDFLNDLYKHKIKTRLGTQKVILNSVDESTRILNRLLNHLVTDLDDKGYLRGNEGTANTFRTDVENEKNQQLTLICKKFGVCRTENGFSEFLVEVLTIMLTVDDPKLQQAVDSLTETAKNMDFSGIFLPQTCTSLRYFVSDVEAESLYSLRPKIMIIKNIIANKNRPLSVTRAEANNCRLNTTVAILEIVDIFEEKLPRTDANIIEWGDLRTSMKDWADNKRFDIQDIIVTFMKHIQNALQTLSGGDQEKVEENFQRIFD